MPGNDNGHLLNRVLIGISTTLAMGAILGGLNTWRVQSVHAELLSQLKDEQSIHRDRDSKTKSEVGSTRESVIKIENELEHIKREQLQQRKILERIEDKLDGNGR